MTDRLSPDDARILGLESTAIAGHTLKLVILEPADRPLDLDTLRASVASRLEEGSRGRDRVEVSADPREGAGWILDEHFDIAAHVRRREGTSGIDERGAWSEAGAIMSERLDHRRPLWAFDVIGPLDDGREAIVARIHHAMADGISCVRFLDEVLWDEVDASPPPRLPAASRAAGADHELRRLPAALARELGHRVKDSMLDRPIGAARELAFTSAPLDRLHSIGASRPERATVNDVLLAAVAGGLRSWMQGAGERLGRLRAQVPVSLHHRDEGAGELSNRDSFLNVDLPLAEPDPLARLDRISAETRARKRLGDAEELYDLFHALARCRPLDRVVTRVATGPHEFSLSISNVPGPRGRLAVCDRAVDRLGSVAEPAQRHALRVSAISCSGTVGIGLCTDPEALAGIADLADLIGEAVDELSEAAIAANR
ncbi:MAG: wax ester/triacylglycerol synthase domain-containing protein [Solirubrobacterales bacterium]